MADIQAYLDAIIAAVYGEDVRGSIYHAIDEINKVSEVVFSSGTAVTSSSSSSTGFYEDSYYLNTDTYELWKCVGTDTWQSLGVIKGDTGNGIASITKTSTAGLVDTYTVTYTDTTTMTFTVTNGEDGNKWYRGTDISGKAPLPTVYPSSGIAKANVNDFYLNPAEGAVYHCVSGGNASTATWEYDFTMSGGAGSLAINDLTDVLIASLVDKQFLCYNGLTGFWENKTVNIPTVGSGVLYIQRNGVSAYNPGNSFTANNTVNATVNIEVDEFIAQGSPNNGSVSFTFDDTVYTGVHGFDVYIDVTSASTNKKPYAVLSSISGEGTSSCTLTYETDADNGTNTAYLRLIK